MTPQLFGEPLDDAEFAIVLLHGRDQPSNAMHRLAEQLDLARTAYVAPRAENGSWYPGRYFDPRSDNEPHLTAAVDSCRQAFELARCSLPEASIALVGFSQGACVVSEFLIREPARSYAAVAMFSGAVMGALEDPAPAGARLTGTRALVTGSVGDSWIRVADTERAAEVVNALGARTTLLIAYDDEHTVRPAELAAFRALLD